MTIQTFIEKAIEGTFYLYDPYYRSRDKMVKFHMMLHERVIIEDEHGYKHRIPVSDILLSPEAWKAVVSVGETEKEIEFGRPDQQYIDDIARARMHRMIDALAEGKTIEQYLETL